MGGARGRLGVGFTSVFAYTAGHSHALVKSDKAKISNHINETLIWNPTLLGGVGLAETVGLNPNALLASSLTAW